MEYKDTIKEILLQIRRDMNGAVVGTMLDILGNERYVNYGVAVPTIKKTAKKYYPNHGLATEMFKSEIRDLKIAAIYIADHTELTMAQMIEWSSSFDEQDILENCCSMLFYKTDQALEVAKQLIDVYPYATMLIVAKHARFCFSEDKIGVYEEIINRINSEVDETILFSPRCRMLAAVASADEKLREFIKGLSIGEMVRKEVESLTI